MAGTGQGNINNVRTDARDDDGVSFSLACDFIKELGYPDYGKADVHIKKIFIALGLSQSEDDYQLIFDSQ